jgi:hypothetical protein
MSNEVSSALSDDLSEDEMRDSSTVVSQSISGCFTAASEKKFGFGLEALELLTINVGLAQERSKIVTGTGHRVTLSE